MAYTSDVFFPSNDAIQSRCLNSIKNYNNVFRSNCHIASNGNPKHNITTQDKIITHTAPDSIITTQTDPIYNITTQTYYILLLLIALLLNKNFAFKSESLNKINTNLYFRRNTCDKIKCF